MHLTHISAQRDILFRGYMSILTKLYKRRFIGTRHMSASDNTSMIFTRHGTTRKQQRAIPQMIIDWLMDYGHHQTQRGVCVATFNKKSRKKVMQYAGNEAGALFEKYANTYMVLASDRQQVITVGHRTIRHKRF